MATVARVLPCHWDGRRLLQFLTGLALVALSFAASIGGTAPTAVATRPVSAVVAAADAPTVLAPVDIETAAPTSAGPDSAAQSAEPNSAAQSAEPNSATHPAEPSIAAATLAVPPPVERAARSGGLRAVAAAAAQLTQGSRAPPRS